MVINLYFQLYSFLNNKKYNVLEEKMNVLKEIKINYYRLAQQLYERIIDI